MSRFGGWGFADSRLPRSVVNIRNENWERSRLSLAFGLSFEDLYQREGLVKLDAIFLDQLNETAPSLRTRLMEARRQPAALNRKQSSELIVELAPYLEDFIGHVFGIEAELRELQFRHAELAPLYS